MEQMIRDMENYAEKHNIPIMQQDGIAFMCDFIKQHNIKKVLEIGSAIGYSAIRMALMADDIEVVTIERDDERYQNAVNNITQLQLQNRIHLIHDDALHVDIKEKFDLLFIDAAKGQYIRFFELFEKNVEVNGYIITDNLKFHGFVEHQELVRSRNLRQLVTKIQKFITYLKNRSDYDTVFMDTGDGIGISRKK